MALHPRQPNKSVVAVDTGSDLGVKLLPQKWREWKAAHPQQPTTLNAYYMPGAGLVAKEESWAGKLSFGYMVLTDVPVMEANVAEVGIGGSGYEGTLGLAALKRLDFIVDGRQGIAYARARKTPVPPYEHNRLGVVFVPQESRSDELVAQVVDGSPAYEAGIRNGDVLLKIGELDVTK